jgi:hypothetical protein
MPPLDPTPNPPEPGLPETITDPILADAATRLGVTVADLTLASAEPVTFPDGGLGCPLPDLNYVQVPVDGYKVVVQAPGKQLDYRGRTAGDFRLCSQTLVPIQLPSTMQ